MVNTLQVIGIVGRSYTGSTLLGRLLATVPEVASVGEANFIVNRKSTCVCGPCAVSSRNCPVITKELLKDTSITEKNLYRALSNHFGKNKIIVSDLYREIYERTLVEDRMAAIVLYKHPIGFVASDLRRKPRTVIEARATLDSFNKVYMDIDEWCKEHTHDHCFVNYEDIVKHPLQMVKNLMARFGIKINILYFDLSIVDYHYINGSLHTLKSLNIEEDRRWETELDDSIKSFVFNDRKSIEVYEAMQQNPLRVV